MVSFSLTVIYRSRTLEWKCSMKSILRFITRRLSVWREDDDSTMLNQLKQVQWEKGEKTRSTRYELNVFLTTIKMRQYWRESWQIKPSQSRSEEQWLYAPLPLSKKNKFNFVRTFLNSCRRDKLTFFLFFFSFRGERQFGLEWWMANLRGRDGTPLQ